MKIGICLNLDLEPPPIKKRWLRVGGKLCVILKMWIIQVEEGREWLKKNRYNEVCDNLRTLTIGVSEILSEYSAVPKWTIVRLFGVKKT